MGGQGKEDRSTHASSERGEMKSSSSVAKLGILRLCLSWGLDAHGCRPLRHRGVVPWWRQGSCATMLLLQEFNLEIKDNKGRKNSVVDHLLRLHLPAMEDISGRFPDKHLLALLSRAPSFAHIINFLMTRLIMEH